MVKEPVEEVARRRPEPSLMEVRKADDVAGEMLRFIFVARDDLLRQRGIH
jgi:hypothetical protein